MIFALLLEAVAHARGSSDMSPGRGTPGSDSHWINTESFGILTHPTDRRFTIDNTFTRRGLLPTANAIISHESDHAAF